MMQCMTPMINNFIVIDNFLNKGYLKKCKAEIKSLEHLFRLEELPVYVKKRVNLDNVYNGRRRDSPILRVMEDTIFSDLVKRIAASKYDPCFKLLANTNFHTTFVTAHLPDKVCGWHTDNVLLNGINNGQLLNFLVYIDMGGKFTEGNIEISYEQVDYIEGKLLDKEPTLDEVIEFKDNRFVMFPAYLWHQVPQIKCKKWENIFDGRISINGHIGIR